MLRRHKFAVHATLALAGLILAAFSAHAQTIPSSVGTASTSMPPALVNVGFEPPLNGQMPLDVPFRDETGRSVQLRDYFSNDSKKTGRPRLRLLRLPHALQPGRARRCRLAPHAFLQSRPRLRSRLRQLRFPRN